ncbi:MAG: PEP-CTERM sorting domain-containing protein [Verrucomicrobia bacterium]|nr:PEP-CTERM sorting domain-containing protein [Verrucomicrobiota bacterium]
MPEASTVLLLGVGLLGLGGSLALNRNPVLGVSVAPKGRTRLSW